MSDEKCPKCGAERTGYRGGNPAILAVWACGTYRGLGLRLDESSDCLRRQLTAAQAVKADLLAACRVAEKALYRCHDIMTLEQVAKEGTAGSAIQVLGHAIAEIDRLRRLEEIACEEVAEFNEGFDAAVRGEPCIEPEGIKHDQWTMGWAWGSFDRLQRLEKAVGDDRLATRVGAQCGGTLACYRMDAISAYRAALIEAAKEEAAK